MIWGGFRPSDDPQTYGYNIPANMFAMASLRHLIDLNTALWNHHALSLDAARLAAAIQQGIETHGVVNHNGQRVYAYEVDGLGGVLVGTDDPNVPSLLAIPLLGYPYDATVYAATRALVLSKENDYFVVQGNVSGLASKHTPTGYVWPLGLMTEALTMGGGDVERQVQIVRTVWLSWWWGGCGCVDVGVWVCLGGVRLCCFCFCLVWFVCCLVFELFDWCLSCIWVCVVGRALVLHSVPLIPPPPPLTTTTTPPTHTTPHNPHHTAPQHAVWQWSHA